MARTRGIEITDNDEATVDPTVNDDVDAGYDIGSRWTNTTTDAVFFCADSAAGAAVWQLVSNLSDYTSNSSDGVSSTTSSTYTTKVSITLPAITATMLIAWSAESQAQKDRQVGVRLRNTTDAATLAEIMQETKQKASSLEWHSNGGVAEIALTGASKVIALQWNSQDNVGSASIRRGRLTAWRIA